MQNTDSEKVNTIIFDLGNVLLYFDHRIILRRFAVYLGVRDDINCIKLQLTTLMERFDRGEIEKEIFIQEFRRVLSVSEELDEIVFTRLWSDIFWKNEEIVRLLDPLSKQVTLVLLSNTNQLHIDYIKNRFPEVLQPFDYTILSFENHLMKPDRLFFEKAVETAGVQPEECLYFDDIQRYIDSAAAIGIHSYQYISSRSVKDVISLYDISFPS